MIRNDSRSGSRLAFTLVELLVVILIIAILVSLLSSAVLKAMQKIPEVQTRTEIAEMAVALQAFMSDYNLTEPPPSSLLLSEDILGGYTPGDPSLTFLKRVFGKNLGIGMPYVDWNGNGVRDGPWRLQGHQCLVWYLGGIVPNFPATAVPNLALGPQGFSTNNINPAALGGKRKGPYFTFVTSRLVPPPATALTAPGFPVYIDPWQTKSGGFYNALTTVPGVRLGGTPYAYFSSYGINNGYSYMDCSGLAFVDSFIPPRQQIALPYYTAFSAGPVPPLGTPIAYTNPNTYQIISAGKDGIFGYNLVPTSSAVPPPPSPGLISNNNIWSPTGGASGAGADDQANFSGSLLGSGQS